MSQELLKAVLHSLAGTPLYLQYPPEYWPGTKMPAAHFTLMHFFVFFAFSAP
ncbi:hypothetical protein [Streptomyces alboflavus]|uniref:hypothetical protein n=1 Tax=Streptomyces alboflavus TaxID=67267 RepID=UPI000AD06A52|nr:hypothetical protein [Streptomyces alboflavus]